LLKRTFTQVFLLWLTLNHVVVGAKALLLVHLHTLEILHLLKVHLHLLWRIRCIWRNSFLFKFNWIVPRKTISIIHISLASLVYLVSILDTLQLLLLLEHRNRIHLHHFLLVFTMSKAAILVISERINPSHMWKFAFLVVQVRCLPFTSTAECIANLSSDIETFLKALLRSVIVAQDTDVLLH